MDDSTSPEQLPEGWVETLFDVLDPEWLAEQFRKLERFRSRFSPLGRWWHRPVEMSPVVPLFYWTMLGLKIPEDQPMGVWRGDPSRILGRLLDEIMEFINYWDSLPVGRGRKQLRHMLRSPGRFFGFQHEVRLALHMRSSGYEVEPLFFDPVSEKGEPDLRVHDSGISYDVQCKSMNPTVASELPYELFQFFAGAYERLVQDSGRSYFLYLHLKERINAQSGRRLLTEIGNLIRSRLTTTSPLEGPDWDVQLVELGSTPGTVSIDGAQRIALQSPGESLYLEMAPISDAHDRSGNPNIAACHITGTKRRGLERFIFDGAKGAARAYRGAGPLIISLAVHQETDMSTYMNGPSVGQSYYRWSKQFFDDHEKVAMVLMSSNYTRYLQFAENEMALGTKYLVVESQHWDGVLPDLGIRGVDPSGR